MGEGHGEDNIEGACQARRNDQGKNDGTGEAENRFTRCPKKEIVRFNSAWPGLSRPPYLQPSWAPATISPPPFICIVTLPGFESTSIGINPMPAASCR